VVRRSRGGKRLKWPVTSRLFMPKERRLGAAIRTLPYLWHVNRRSEARESGTPRGPLEERGVRMCKRDLCYWQGFSD